MPYPRLTEAPAFGDEQVSVISNADTCFGVATVLSEDNGEAAEIVPNWERRKARSDAARLLRSAEKRKYGESVRTAGPLSASAVDGVPAESLVHSEGDGVRVTVSSLLQGAECASEVDERIFEGRGAQVVDAA
jgi:hypothetical protein